MRRAAVANVKTVCGSIRRTVKICVRPPHPLSCSFSDRHLGQMMNCKLDMARMERGKEREGDRRTCACDESCPNHVPLDACLYWQRHLVLPTLLTPLTVTHCCALSKLKSCSTKLWPTISSKTKDLPDFETIMLSGSVNRIK